MRFWLWQYLKSLPPNFGKVTPTIYRSAQPDHEQLVRWKAIYQLETVLNLRNDAGEKERKEAESEGLLYVNIPMADDLPPTMQQVRRAMVTLRTGMVTLVNCKGGRHRTGVIIAAYRCIAQGETRIDAWREAYKYGFYTAFGHKPIEDWFLREFEPANYEELI